MKRFVLFTLLAMSSGAYADEQVWQQQAHDAWVAGKVETTLLLNDNLNSFSIETHVVKGVVTLRGDVDTSVERALAEELIMSLYGVKDVNNRIEIADQDDGDTVLEEAQSELDAKVETVVKTRLLLEASVRGLAIDVNARNGIVTLKGFVNNHLERELALAITRNTNDVNGIIDKLVIGS